MLPVQENQSQKGEHGRLATLDASYTTPGLQVSCLPVCGVSPPPLTLAPRGFELRGSGFHVALWSQLETADELRRLKRDERSAGVRSVGCGAVNAFPLPHDSP